jgi:hypothetical protein
VVTRTWLRAGWTRFGDSPSQMLRGHVMGSRSAAVIDERVERFRATTGRIRISSSAAGSATECSASTGTSSLFGGHTRREAP